MKNYQIFNVTLCHSSVALQAIDLNRECHIVMAWLGCGIVTNQTSDLKHIMDNYTVQCSAVKYNLVRFPD